MSRPSSTSAAKLCRLLCGGVFGWLLLSACSNDERGEVMVIVTTDMALPADLDWLEWTVSRPAHPDKAPEHGSFALDQPSALPATLAIVSGDGGAEPVTVTVVAKTGGAEGAPRVSREARFTVPESGQKMLNMPLNWLCSDANLEPACAAGTTCQAGKCVDSQLAAELFDYEPLKPLPCFDVLGCTLTGGVWRASPPSTNEAGHCIMDASSVLSGAMSVALIVNAEQAGNAGVCAPNADGSGSAASPAAGLCFVPLDRDSGPDGYQLVKNAQHQTEIQLPDGVCAAFARGSIKRVALTRTDCPTKTSARPLCAPPSSSSSCVAAPSSCPAVIPASWSGYSCSGAERPSASTLSYCGVTDNDPDEGPVVRGHYCCTSGQEPAEDPLLIDDMSGGPLIKLRPPPGDTAGDWFTASDDIERPLSPSRQPQTLFTYRAIDPVTLPDGPTIRRAACFRMREGFSGYYALEGFNFFSDGAEAVPVDVSRFSGISFWATLTGLGADPPPAMRVVFPNSDTDTQHLSTCMQPALDETNCNHFGKKLELTSDWQKVSVTWDELTQASDFGMMFGMFEPHVYSVDFQASGPGPSGLAPPFEFCVSQIRFTE